MAKTSGRFHLHSLRQDRAEILYGLFGKTTSPEEAEHTIKILSILGRIMARVTDVIELEPDEMPALKIALCKRLSADCNEILGLMEKLGNTDEETAEILHLAREEVLHLRGDALAIIREIRTGKNG